jgi:hypothetical protein
MGRACVVVGHAEDLVFLFIRNKKWFYILVSELIFDN